MTAPRLQFEELHPRHAAILFDDLRDPGLYTFIPEEPPGSLEALTRRFEQLAAGSAQAQELWRNWVMFDAGRAVGTLQATVSMLDDARDALIAYAVLPRCWRQGHGAAGVRWMLDQLHARDRVHRAEALIDTRNIASIRLVESLGFARVATAAAEPFKGAPSMEHRYARRLGPLVLG